MSFGHRSKIYSGLEGFVTASRLVVDVMCDCPVPGGHARIATRSVAGGGAALAGAWPPREFCLIADTAERRVNKRLPRTTQRAATR
jgi:hypothetical protein